jgi:cell wall-associated NlpC family hydrolase
MSLLRLAGLLLLIALAASACGRRLGPPPRFPGAIPPPPAPAAGSPPPRVPGAVPPPRVPSAAAPATAGEADAIVASALALQGTAYRNGGTDPTGFDCSGLVQYVFAKHGVALPRSVSEQYRAGNAVARDALATGDLVFFTTVTAGASHVGIVVEGDWFVHAPSARGVVRVDRLSAQYWAQRYIGARRVIAGKEMVDGRW